MLLICLGMTIVAAVTTFFYRFKRINYTKLAKHSDVKSIQLHSMKTIMFTPHGNRSEVA